jgi:hypothetical protein
VKSVQVAQTDPDAQEQPDHELVRRFAEQGLPLNSTLREMLNEHYSHRTERRGAGFTQATRHLAALVNERAHAPGAPVLRMFAAGVEAPRSSDVLASLLDRLEREESQILARIIFDLAFPRPVDGECIELGAWPEDLKIGTCPLAEKYFLELADAFVRRKGLANVLVSSRGQPVLIEKLNLGDDHSCISVAPVVLNGVRLPPGSLLGVRYEALGTRRKNKTLPGEVIAIDSCSGFRFLRLSTLAVSPWHRARAFTTHFQAQVVAGLFAPHEATIEQLRRLAESQL